MYKKYIKRFIDIVISFIALIILSPVYLLIAIFIKIIDNGPIMYKQIRTGKDGKEFKNFHEKCDGEKNKNNLVLVETKNGFKIGGFTYDFWESNLKSKKGKESFIFSLNKKEKYPLLYGNYSIFCDIQLGPTFNKCDFAFTGNDMTKIISKGVCYYLYDKGSLLSNKNKEILNDYVDVKEVEVFQILFN